MDKKWFRGFLEAEASFGVYLNLLSGKNTKYLVLKPYVQITLQDDDVAKHFHETLFKSTNITDKKERKDKKDKRKITSVLNTLRVQDFSDIDRLLEVLDGHTFISRKKQGLFVKFRDAYAYIKRIGHVWKAWDPEIEKFIDECLPLQENKRGFTNEEWKQRIREHFNIKKS